MSLIKSKKTNLGLLWCFPAAFFLFNPNINIIDLLPDFVAYFFLSLAFAKLGELNDSVAGAVSAFRRMILIDLGKWAAVIWVFGMTVPTERNSSLLLWTFVFAVLEMIFALPAFLKLFDGLTQIGFLYPNESLLEANRKRRKSRTDRIKGATCFLIVAKGVLSTLPELADLTNTSYDETARFVNLYRFIGVMRILAFLPMLIIGIVWIVRFVRYFNRLRKDRTLWDVLSEKYVSDVLPRTGMFVRRNVRSAVVLILIGIVLTMDFRLERVNVIPDLFAAFFFILAVFKLKKYLDISGRNAWFGVLLYLFATGAETLLERRFFANYSYYAVLRSLKAEVAYGWWVGAVVVKNVMLLLAVLSLFLCLRRTIALHTGSVEGREQVSDREDALVRGLHRELNFTMIPVAVATVVYGAADILYAFFDRMVGFMGLIQVVAAVIWLILFARALFTIRNAVDTKYMLS